MIPLWMPRVTSKLAVGLSAIMLFPFLASYFFMGGEKGIVWTALIAAGLTGLIWVWGTGLCETLRGKTAGAWVISKLGQTDADEKTQRQIRWATHSVIRISSVRRNPYFERVGQAKHFGCDAEQLH